VVSFNRIDTLIVSTLLTVKIVLKLTIGRMKFNLDVGIVNMSLNRWLLNRIDTLIVGIDG